MRFLILFIFLSVIILVETSCHTDDYCPGNWNVQRKSDGTPKTCDAMGGVKCEKPYSCVHSRCGMDFCCAHQYKIAQFKKDKEIEADIEEARLEDEKEEQEEL
ncbi:unnamed protein product [Caenorhabditis angaria]|uniref:WAP domain-containing protein n=1 Tax=Caenorhabditis angaria TaxID=860376 RepID=A0A9P1N8B7_9PELO|nr:unnamed protein product [Caenorhabditis angaria]